MCEELDVAMCFMHFLVLDRLRDLLKFGLHICVLEVAVRMQFLVLSSACYINEQTHRLQTYSQSPEPLVGFAMSDQPSRALREEQNKTSEGKSRNDLYAERYTPLSVVC